MKKHGVLMLLFVVAEYLVGINVAIAQSLSRSGGYGHVGSQLNRRLDTSEEALKSVLAERAGVAKQLVEAQANLREKDRDLRIARVEVRTEHDKTSELMHAREEFRQAQASFVNAKNAVLSELRETSVYKAAIAAREDAAATVRNWPTGPQFEKTHLVFARELTEAVRHVQDLEEHAIESDLTTAPAKQERDEMAAKLAKLVAQRDANSASDPRLKSAKLSRDRAQEAVNRLRNEVAIASKKVEQSERAYQSSVQQRLAFDRAEQANRWYGWGPWHP